MSDDITKIIKAVTDLKTTVAALSTQKNNVLVTKLDKFLDAVEKKKVSPTYATKYLNEILFKDAPPKSTSGNKKKDKTLVAVFMSEEENIEPMVKKYFRELKSKQIIDSII